MLKRRRKLNLFDLKLFKEFLTSEDERRELQKIPAAKPQQFATKFVLGVRCQQGFHWHLHLSKVYISLPSWTVTLAARFTFWHKIYVNFKLNSSLFVHIVYKDITRRREDMNCIFDSTCFHDSKIKFISSLRRVISSIRNLTKLRNYLYT